MILKAIITAVMRLTIVCTRLRTRRRSAKDDEHIYEVPDIAPDKHLPHHFDMSINAAYGEGISSMIM